VTCGMGVGAVFDCAVRMVVLTMHRAPMQDGSTALHVAAENGEETAMQALLEAGADHAATDKVRAERGRESGGLRGGGAEAGTGKRKGSGVGGEMLTDGRVVTGAEGWIQGEGGVTRGVGCVVSVELIICSASLSVSFLFASVCTTFCIVLHVFSRTDVWLCSLSLVNVTTSWLARAVRRTTMRVFPRQDTTQAVR
jgi:hypothetical protein